MAHNRPIKKLGEICSLQNGYAFKSSDYVVKSNTLNFRMSNIRIGGQLDIEHNKKCLPDSYAEEYKQFLLNDGDIVIAMTDMATETKILAIPTTVKTDGRNLLLNQRVGRFIIDQNQLLPDYLKCILLVPQVNQELKKKGGGGLQINLSTKDILNLEIPLPPLATQKLIVAKLDETFAQIDEAITATQANIDQTEELTKSVLDKVFEEGEWEMKKIEKIVEKTELWNPLKKPNEVFDYVDISSIDNKLFSITETKEILGKDAPSRAKKLIEKGDILYATTRPNLKNIALCEINKPNLTCSTGFCVLRTKKKELFNRYLFYCIITDGFFKKIEKYIRGAQYPAVSDKDIKNIEIPLPPLAKQQEIVDHLDHVFAQSSQLKEQYQKKLVELKELKASVLQSAFSGELV